MFRSIEPTLQITFLGTSSGVPTRARNVSAVALRLPQRAEVWLFDCGEATQHQLQRTPLRISQISRIFITHLHGDHLFGLLGLIATCGMAGEAQEINIYGPEGLAQYVRACAELSRTTLSASLKIHTVEPGLIYRDDEYSVTCQPLKHRITSFGYRVTESDRPGRFDVERALALGVPSGPLYGRLKRGESVELADGRVIHGRELNAAPVAGRVVAYCTDTMYCRSAVSLAERADLLIHEATFADEDEPLAVQSMHSTATVAARVASEAQVRRLLLTHFSPRYTQDSPVTIDNLLAQARAVFPQTDTARDFLTYEVPRREQDAG
ncbi:MAG TPA: ribonuclease Z [Pyrinomonadaceae bacterium]|nr:ribonuclease Z [Pyrinomonadaceae bacterium]